MSKKIEDYMIKENSDKLIILMPMLFGLIILVFLWSFNVPNTYCRFQGYDLGYIEPYLSTDDYSQVTCIGSFADSTNILGLESIEMNVTRNLFWLNEVHP